VPEVTKQSDGNATTTQLQRFLDTDRKKRSPSREGPEPRGTKVARTEHSVELHARDKLPVKVKELDLTSNGKRKESTSDANVPKNDGTNRRDSGVSGLFDEIPPYNRRSPSDEQRTETSNPVKGVGDNKKRLRSPASDESNDLAIKIINTNGQLILPSIDCTDIADIRPTGSHNKPGPESPSPSTLKAPPSAKPYQPVASEHSNNIDSSIHSRPKGSTIRNIDLPFACNTTINTPSITDIRLPNTNSLPRK